MNTFSKIVTDRHYVDQFAKDWDNKDSLQAGTLIRLMKVLCSEVDSKLSHSLVQILDE